MEDSPKYIYAVVHKKSGNIMYNGFDKEMMIATAKREAADDIPYCIIEGEL